MAIEEVFLGAFLAVLFEKAASPYVREIAGRLNIHRRLEKLKDRLEDTQKLLDDAENKQITSDAVAVRRWLGGLRCWAQDAEDLLDEFATKCQLERAADVDMACSSWIVDTRLHH